MPKSNTREAAVQDLSMDSTHLIVNELTQLFVDNLIIEQVQDVTRRWHQPVRYGDRPVIQSDQPWEHITYFTYSSYAVFYDPTDGRFKCWYCNITRPARITGGTVASDDLALDLLIEPEGQAILLDRDEFDALALDQNERESALAALRELQNRARAGRLARWITTVN